MRPACLPVLAASALGCATAAYTPPSAPSVVSTFADRQTAAMVALLAAEINAQRAPELQVRIETRDGRALSAVLGTRDLARREVARPDDCVRVGSVTKLLVAVVAMRLAERGVIRLDEPVARLLPELPRGNEITPLHLLSHRAGVPDVLGFGSLVGATLSPRRVYSTAELLAGTTGSRPGDAPGTRYEYSNGSYVVLGALLERATKTPVRTLLAEHVLGPAALKSTWLAPVEPPPGCLVVGHDRGLIPFGHDLQPRDTSFASLAWTSGGLVSTAADLAAVLRGVRDATLVSAESRDAMLPRWEATGEHDERAVGLGLFRFALGDRSYVGHAGLFIGSQALAVWDEADGTLFVVAGNRSTLELGRIVVRLGELVRARP